MPKTLFSFYNKSCGFSLLYAYKSITGQIINRDPGLDLEELPVTKVAEPLPQNFKECQRIVFLYRLSKEDDVSKKNGIYSFASSLLTATQSLFTGFKGGVYSTSRQSNIRQPILIEFSVCVFVNKRGHTLAAFDIVFRVAQTLDLNNFSAAEFKHTGHTVFYPERMPIKRVLHQLHAEHVHYKRYVKPGNQRLSECVIKLGKVV